MIIRIAASLGLQDGIHGVFVKDLRIALREPRVGGPLLRIKTLVAQIEGLVVPAGANDGLRGGQRPLVEPHEARRLRGAVPFARGNLPVDHRRLDARNGHRRIVRNLLSPRAENAEFVQGVFALHVVVSDIAAEKQTQVLRLHVDRAEQSLPVFRHFAAAVAPQFQLPPPTQFEMVPLVLLPVARETAVADELPLLVPHADAGLAEGRIDADLASARLPDGQKKLIAEHAGVLDRLGRVEAQGDPELGRAGARVDVAGDGILQLHQLVEAQGTAELARDEPSLFSGPAARLVGRRLDHRRPGAFAAVGQEVLVEMVQ